MNNIYTKTEGELARAFNPAGYTKCQMLIFHHSS